VVYPEGEESFEYDFAGNRINRTMKGITTRYNYDNRNRLIEKIEGGMHTAYRYDPQGNLLEEEGRRGTTRYTYDCFNRTESVRTAEGGFIRNRYDPEGLRYELYENGKVNKFIFSGREVVTEVDADYGLKVAIIRGHELLAQKDNKDSYYYLNNAHGDVTALVDGRGEVVNRYRYDAFGNTVEAVEKVHNRFRYAGEQFDPVTGQYYLRARFYNPVIGRFTQEDTYRGDGLNLYSYVANNPVKYVDPSGYCGETKSSVFSNDNPKGKKGTGGVLLPVNPVERQIILKELQNLTSKNLAVDRDGYVYIDKEADFSTTPKGDELIERLVNSNRTCTIEISYGTGNAHGSIDQDNAINGVGSDSIVYFDPASNPDILTLNPATGRVEPKPRPSYIGLGHELIHADRSMRGVKIDKSVIEYQTYTDMFGKTWVEKVRAEELATVGISHNKPNDITENCLRKEHGLGIRGAY